MISLEAKRALNQFEHAAFEGGRLDLEYSSRHKLDRAEGAMRAARAELEALLEQVPVPEPPAPALPCPRCQTPDTKHDEARRMQAIAVGAQLAVAGIEHSKVRSDFLSVETAVRNWSRWAYHEATGRDW